ncbi:hypothetical protein J5A70_09070 [Prevotella nigrescens]|uniref:hypothetical protein n=1 Tax=Prevotella nigrescens TaxID=28133 RepID=UPI001BA6F9AD|nr:hypothetical protein [Prevotella nigrescens]QUB49115.1 hypothetical protein J5A70_09070 [Prevotella nigrescens]
MEKTYKNNKQNNISFIKQWIERYNNTSHDFYDDYHIDEIDNNLPKAKELWWNASVHIYYSLAKTMRKFNIELQSQV